MAHSNRKDKKAARGGLTKNQALKVNRHAQQAERLRAVLQWERDRLVRTQTSQPDRKVKKVNMWRSTQLRRITAKELLEVRLKITKDEDKIKKIQAELAVLKTRINIAA